ncbi:hypothetical protein A9Q87_05005 [Flavobacteriales bacterium 34_180_T64]|nr:hypothetical protein A9Q87_05005 [Flavobacteriales bacterium 34_180_T64]
MKKDYTLKSLIILMLLVFPFLKSNAQIRIVEVDPSTNRITIRNFGSSSNPENISNYWLCKYPTYEQFGGMTIISGSFNLAVGSEVTFTSSIPFDVVDGELGIYNTSSFGSSTAMEDYMQWGTAGHEREAVAVAKGIWTAGTTITAAPPFEYTGNGSQNGIAFWDTLLGIEDFENRSSFGMYPNPSNDILNIKLKNGIRNVTLEVYNVLGKLVLNQTLKPEKISKIQVSSLDAGLYLVKIANGNNSETKRFVKQ